MVLRQGTYRIVGLVLAMILVGGNAPRLLAQFGSASVVGYARDTTGAAVPSAQVTLTNVATNVTVVKSSDKDGQFEFDSVPIGNYRLTSSAPSFETTKTEVFNLSTDARQRVDVSMKLGAVSDTVEVTSAAQLLETETSSRSQVIATREVENLPLNGRSYADLVLLAPGTRKSQLENQSASSREGAFNVNGQRSAFNEFILDGLENSNYGTSNQGFEDENIAPSPDAVSEFRVETNNYSAEYGRQPGAVINVSTRSGTNQFHGRAWDYFRNTILNAVGPIEPVTNTKPKLIRNQFGGTVGGPIIKDKTFFFIDYEAIRQIFNYQLAPVTLPDSEQRLGQFVLHRVDGSTQPIPVYNPVTGTSYTTGSAAAGATPFALAVLGYLPANNVGGTAPAFSNVTNNYSNAPRGTINDDKGDARIDQNFTKFKLFGRYSDHRATIFDPPTIGGLAGGNANSNVSIQNRQIAGGVTWIINQNKLLDVRFAWTRNIGKKTPFNVGQPSLLAQFGITDGLPTDPTLIRPLNGQSISGFTQLGDQTSSPQFQNPTIYNPKAVFTWIHGKHSMKYGMEAQFIHTQVNDFNPSYGQDNYASKYAAGPTGLFLPCATTASTGCIPTDTATGNTAATQIAEAQEVADFLFGNRSSYSLTNFTIVNLRQRYGTVFFQDDFKVSPNLTLNLGLRYEIMTPQFEANNKLANFNPTNNTLTQASDGSIFQRALVHIPTKNFSPRFGFSYSYDPKTVVRGGYGITYVQFNRAGGENNLTYNGPNVVNAAINNPSPFAAVANTPATNNCATNGLGQDTQSQTGCFRQTQLGYSNILTSSANFNPLNVTSRYIPANFQTGYVQSYFVGIQRQLPGAIMLDLAYIGNKSTHLQILADYNQAAPCLLASVTACNTAGQTYQARRPVPTFGDIEIATNEGSANYNSLQAKVEKRFGALYILNSFTWSRTFDLSSGHLETAYGDNSRVNFANPRADYGPSGYDQPIDNTTSVVWDLPYGRGRKYGASAGKFANELLGGWQLTMINTMTSGLPFNITYSGSSSAATTPTNGSGPLFTTDLATLRPLHLQGTPLRNNKSAFTKASNKAALTNYLPASSYAFPSFATYGSTSAYGNVSRNIMRAFCYYDTDLGLHKQFDITENRVKLDFRAEAFNAFNVTDWQAPDGNISNGTFGSITTAFPARQFQFAAKVLF